jgi:hypothetical protein
MAQEGGSAKEDNINARFAIGWKKGQRKGNREESVAMIKYSN